MFSGIGELFAGVLNPLWTMLSGLIAFLVSAFTVVIQYLDPQYAARQALGALASILPEPLGELFWSQMSSQLTGVLYTVREYVMVLNLFVHIPWFFIMFSYFAFGEGAALPWRVIRFFRSLWR